MGTHATISDFLGNLRDELTSRSGLDGVTIITGAIAEPTDWFEAIVFAVEDVPVDLTYPYAPGDQAVESYNVDGRVWVVTPGAGEEIIVAARERAVELMAEVQEALNAHQTTADSLATYGVDDARIVRYVLTQLPGDGYRDCRITFTIAVKARFTPE